MHKPNEFSDEEIARRGEEIYQRDIRPHVESGHHGKFFVLDVLTGDYEIDVEDAVASDRLLERQTDGILYGVRIGFPVAYRL